MLQELDLSLHKNAQSCLRELLDQYPRLLPALLDGHQAGLSTGLACASLRLLCWSSLLLCSLQGAG